MLALLSIALLVSLFSCFIALCAYLVSARRLLIHLRDNNPQFSEEICNPMTPNVSTGKSGDAFALWHYLFGTKPSGIFDSRTVSLENRTRRSLRVLIWAVAAVAGCAFLMRLSL